MSPLPPTQWECLVRLIVNRMIPRKVEIDVRGYEWSPCVTLFFHFTDYAPEQKLHLFPDGTWRVTE